MEKAERVILTNLCMIRDGSKVLVEEKVGKGADGIIFPGGHVEAHEPIVDAVIREMKEETGLTITSPRLCGVKEWINEDAGLLDGERRCAAVELDLAYGRPDADHGGRRIYRTVPGCGKRLETRTEIIIREGFPVKRNRSAVFQKPPPRPRGSPVLPGCLRPSGFC